ncbi:recombinase RecT [Thermus sp. 93170]|uniref:recombinase RecT n=1 Tax=Thermus sp. 93170 TaxID=1046939 RepID=UPI003F43A870
MIEKKENKVVELARKKFFSGVPDEDVALALMVAKKYGLDPLLRHVVLIPGGRNGRYNVYITRDGLLHVAHASGRAWSLEVGEPERRENPYTGKPDIYLKGRLRVVDQEGREQVFDGGVWFSEYAQKGGAWSTHPAAMHQKVLEVYLLRRAFDVALTPVEEVGVEAPASPVPVETLPPETPITREQMARIAALAQKLGMEREELRAFAVRVVEREVGSARELTQLEADLVIEALEALAPEGGGQVEPEGLEEVPVEGD